MTKQFNVCVLGAAGGIGQPLSLLLTTSPYVKKLHLYDVVPMVEGVGVDLSHVCTPVEVKGFVGSIKDSAKSAEVLATCLKDMDVILCPAGLPRKPGMTRDDLFGINAGIMYFLAEQVALNCPNAMFCIISNPVNSTVPIAAEVLKIKGVYNPKRLFGISTLDIVRATKFISDLVNVDPKSLDLHIVGGHSGVTILPLLSQLKLASGREFTDSEIESLTKRIQTAGTEVVKAKAGAGSATLSMAYAGFRFATSVMKGMSGEKDVVECSYVQSDVTELSFFATKVLLGTEGIEKIYKVGEISEYEKNKLETEVKPALTSSIEKGVLFVKKKMSSL